jgi:hypothetical protein
MWELSTDGTRRARLKGTGKTAYELPRWSEEGRFRSPSASRSATRTGVMVIEAGAVIVYRPPRWWLICGS